MGQAVGVEEGPAEDANAEGQAGAHAGDVPLRLLLTAGHDQHVEERRPCQHLRREEDQGVGPQFVGGQVEQLVDEGKLAEPEQHAARRDRAEGQAVDHARQLARDLVQQAKQNAQHGAAAHHGDHQGVFPRPLMHPGDADDQADEDADVNQPRAFKQ